MIRVAFENGETKEYAASLAEHILNQPPKIVPDDETFNPQAVLKAHGEQITETLEKSLKDNKDFVRVAGRWFPRALLVDINAGHLNLAEAVLDMAGGGPMANRRAAQTGRNPSQCQSQAGGILDGPGIVGGSRVLTKSGLRARCSGT